MFLIYLKSKLGRMILLHKISQKHKKFWWCHPCHVWGRNPLSFVRFGLNFAHGSILGCWFLISTKKGYKVWNVKKNTKRCPCSHVKTWKLVDIFLVTKFPSKEENDSSNPTIYPRKTGLTFKKCVFMQNRSSRPEIKPSCQFQKFSSRGKFFHFIIFCDISMRKEQQ